MPVVVGRRFGIVFEDGTVNVDPAMLADFCLGCCCS